MKQQGGQGGFCIIVLGCLAFCAIAQPVWPHCDTVEGPVIQDARRALEIGEVTPVLKWIGETDEAEIRDVFADTLEVRAESATAREMADHYFFETLVRVHRATEGFGYTGLKPASAVDPMIFEADEALETGSAGALIAELTEQVEAELHKRFEEALEKKQHADDSVEQGREYVAAYVRFVHYVEALRESTKAGHLAHAGGHDAHAAHDEHN